ncbi:hydrogen peroxide-inducible genes activator [Salinibius halmophilus]|uniref:hydrogen peroxide-inducible genes activator n=1 Tax=Salinibius halmophilus TaxID=1853216 RepID=UPI000E664D3D|nr:hydrogen peroxide-inducible genes activator [Salinibius halmophilus]
MRALPSTKHLRYLLALYDFRHFGKAASECAVSQSAFSLAIKELEQRLGVQLVDRTNRSLTFTEVGEQVVISARRSLSELENLADIAMAHQDPLAGSLKLGVIPTIAPFVLPYAVQSIRKDYPKLQLYLVEDQTQVLYEQLMAGQLDLLMLALPMQLQHTETVVLFRDYFHLVWSAERKQAPDEDVQSWPDSSILLLEDGHCMRDHALDACQLSASEKVSRFAATSLTTLMQMVASDLGVSYLTDMSVNSSFTKSLPLRSRPVEPPAYREIGLVWRKGSGREPGFRQLAELLANIDGDLLNDA